MKSSSAGLILLLLGACSDHVEYAGPDFLADLPEALALVPSDLGGEQGWFDPETRVGVHYTYFPAQKSEYATRETFIDWFATAYEMDRPRFVETSIGHLIAVEANEETVDISLVSCDYDEIWLAVTFSIRVDGEETPEARELVFQTLAAISAGQFNRAYKNQTPTSRRSQD